jgi:hypothetical protein
VRPLHNEGSRRSSSQPGGDRDRSKGKEKAQEGAEGVDDGQGSDGSEIATVFDGLNFEGDSMFDPFMGYTSEGPLGP